MIAGWIEAGQDYDTFWTLTLREVDRILAGYQQRVDRENELAYFVAYHSGLFSQPWGKRFPKYEQHKPRQRRQRQAKTGSDWRAMKASLLAFTAAVGGDIIKKGE